MAGFFEKLKERVFGKPKKAIRVQRKSPSPTVVETREETVKLTPQPAPKLPEREPYFIQIGFDFGTAFSKCVCRDVFLDKAWVHLSPCSTGSDMSFLMASAISFDGDKLRHSGDSSGAYAAGGLYHVKMALEKVALGNWEDPVLKAYREAVPGETNDGVARFVEICATYLIGGALGNVREEVRRKYLGRVEGDYLAVNMAVPVADANDAVVNDLFDRVLRNAWVLADDLVGHVPMSCSEFEQLRTINSGKADSAEVRNACFIYPEVSANVQGFVRSRTSSDGLYLFSDTGAGTVDQSVFLFARPDGQDHLTYLHAGVYPLGSSHLEMLAAAADGDESWENFERWRKLKESGEDLPELKLAREAISEDLKTGTFRTLSLGKQKLVSRRQFSSLRVIFGGGGHCQDPYRKTVIGEFDGNLFRASEIENRREDGDSFDLGMPLPRDLELDSNRKRWMDRLTVAYGLSFERGQLATFTLPKDVEVPTEEQIWRPQRPVAHAPSKDEV